MSRIVLGALMFLVACSMPTLPVAQPSPTPTKPQVNILAPANGTAFAFGTDVIVQSVSSDASGIVRVDLIVDVQVVRTDVPPGGQSTTPLQVAQVWKATSSGVHSIIVRAMNSAGAIGEAALTITVNEPPKPTNTPVIPTVTPAPPQSPVTVAPPVSVPPTRTRTPTIASGATQHTLTLTEAQVNTIIKNAIASGQIPYVSNASVSLQNGQITITASYAPPGFQPINAKMVVTVSASGCTLHVTVVQATFGIFVLNDAQKATLSQTIEQELKKQLPQQTYCVDSVSIANGVMTIKYH
jgi:hypothetical protein